MRGMLGRYRIERQIAQGAMGAIYLGIDPQTLQPVALKTLRLAAEFAGPELEEARQRFFREAQAAGRLRHPGIVQIFESGEDSGVAYIAMELLVGHDLSRHTRSDQLLDVSQVLHIGQRVAEALACAHSQGVVHRDIKPANVVVDLPSGGVKVTDFGIACVTDASRTRTGMVLGTPSYMSPEQVIGSRPDGRADLYSLGVMLFQLLSGRLPHQHEAMGRLLHAIVNEPAPEIGTLRPELPLALSGLLAKLLSKRPESRQADGLQLAAELGAVAATWRARGGA